MQRCIAAHTEAGLPPAGDVVRYVSFIRDGDLVRLRIRDRKSNHLAIELDRSAYLTLVRELVADCARFPWPEPRDSA
jgi:hypothetical protein